MFALTPSQIATLRPWFLPDHPGPLVGLHVIHTGKGACLVDRWPAPQVILAEIAGNYTLLGNAQALTPTDLQPHVKGFVDASAAFAPLLKAAFPDLRTWPRVIFSQPHMSDSATPVAASVRRIGPSDAHHLRGLSSESSWISIFWGGPDGLASSGYGWGAFVDGQLAAVACTAFLGETYEDIGVVTEPQFRGLGLSPACVQGLCGEIRARGHQPSWTTSPDNVASMRVAEKLGFVLQRQGVLYVVGIPIPEPARR